ncbi:MAG: peptidoglycan-associated lipoprotein Pal [Gammaproteobacteria bacterium]
MSIKTFLQAAVLGLFLSSLVACSSTNGKGAMDAGDNSMYFGGAAAGTVSTQGVGDQAALNGQSKMTEQELLAQRVYHFAFDSSQIEPDDRPALMAQAHYLASHSDAHVLLAGNTDSRGSREYNIALGWRRAKSIEQLLLLNGVNPNQIRLVSYGQEKPVALGDTDEAYAQNRRVDLNYES